jgi:hypothetical protein
MTRKAIHDPHVRDSHLADPTGKISRQNSPIALTPCGSFAMQQSAETPLLMFPLQVMNWAQFRV